ncbi:DUF7010 family protein [Alishewanella tabrizica]|uniref:Uncharacterized protein n=1 Tax=Alishewanella tabrizica TaxID=671278 RepID=A0ABQ2WP24_9ALTE|nr:hypothetical protein [Alishewanella tabrizica]GGW66351.1 hypothetical protein GCM10008111_22900 [Alishewanella tabrizica]
MHTFTLEQQRKIFSERRFLAMPLSGLLVWLTLAFTGWLLSPYQATLAIFIGTGSIVYLGMLIARFTGETIRFSQQPKNVFDKLFLHGVAMSLLVYAIAIPYFLADYRSLPFTVGVLSGLMWLPLGWIIQHWIGIFHAVVRTLLCTACWVLFPEQSMVLIPIGIVLIYALSILVLELRWHRLSNTTSQFSSGVSK